MPVWTDDLAAQVASALKSRGLCTCPTCGSKGLELQRNFCQPDACRPGSRRVVVTDRVPVIDDEVFIRVICKNCGLLSHYQMKRLGPFKFSANDGLWMEIERYMSK